jgi:hypothetical protein
MGAKQFTIGALLLVLMLWGVLPTRAEATVTANLADRNSTLECCLDTSQGMKTWEVDGVDHLWRQWFWYRIGPTGGEKSLDTLGLIAYRVTDNDWDDGNEHLTALYGDRDVLTVELSLTLAGGSPGSKRSDIAETITITNYGSDTLDFHFIQYCDLDLGGTSYDLSAEIRGGNTAQQASQNIWASETVVTPFPAHHEVSYYPSLYNSLGDANPTTLNDNVGPIISGDMVWGFQWDCPIGPGSSLIISKDKTIVPEPGTAALLVLGAAGIAPRRLRKR